jgi:hypothetical protein
MSIAALLPTTLPHERRNDSLEVPAKINGVFGVYGLDSGAAFSYISESGARRVGMRILEIDPIQVQGFSGASSRITKLGIAETLDLGEIQLRNVPFAIFSDQAVEGIVSLHGGSFGIQVLLACRTVQWNAAGNVHLGARLPGDRNIRASNVCMDGLVPRIEAGFKGRKLNFKLDTGSDTSYLLEPFATEFPDIVKSGLPGKWTFGGIGSSGTEIAATTLPELEVRVGSRPLTMRPARLVEIPGALGHGLLGLDVFKDTRSVTLDFRTMMLTVQ